MYLHTYQLTNTQHSISKMLSLKQFLKVLVEPEKPVITRQPSGAVEEGELVTIECQTTGGNPPPSFVWVFSNRSVVPEEWYHIRSSISPDGPFVSVLQ